ncbi:MAG: hypothetical protein ISS48_04715 [Candidatus Aenigmarchaeota archaeon]|nr:hypothetical protein [Candidatus Aenigmarchaeota archaeon]
MAKKSNIEKKSFRMILTVNLLLVMLLAAALFIFMILLRSINPELSKGLTVVVYVFIVVLTLLTGITGIIVFLVLARKKMI